MAFNFMRLHIGLLICLGFLASTGEPSLARDRTELVIEAGMHTAQIDSVSADRDCELVATGARDRTIRLWHGKTGLLERTIYPPIGDGRHNGQVPAVAVHPKGEWIAAVVAIDSGEAVMIFDRRRDDILWQSPLLGTSILSLAVSPDGNTLAASMQSGGGVIVWQRQPSGDFTQIAHDTDYDAQDAVGLTVDRRGRIFAISHQGLVKRYDPPYAAKPTSARTSSGRRPNAIAMPLEGRQLAVSYNDSSSVDIISSDTLALARTVDNPDMDFPPNALAWSRDGARLYAGGSWPAASTSKVRVWQQGGRKVADTEGPGDAVTSMASCPDGAVVATAAPGLGRLGPGGERQPFWKERVTVDMRSKRFGDFKVSGDGARVRFGLERARQDGDTHLSRRPVLFDVREETLLDSPVAPPGLTDADTDPAHLPLTGWYGIGNTVKLADRPLKFEDWEEAARSAAIVPDRSGFVVGTDYNIRGYHRDGRELWPPRAVLSYTWGLNIASAARIIVAAHGDGTVRWYRMSDGMELLALFVNAKDRRWVAWTPKGYYMASPGGENLIGFRVHQGWKKSERFGRVQSYRGQFYRPDIVRQVLLDQDEASALRNVDATPAARSSRGVAPVLERRATKPATPILTPAVSVPMRGPATLPEVEGMPEKAAMPKSPTAPTASTPPMAPVSPTSPIVVYPTPPVPIAKVERGARRTDDGEMLEGRDAGGAGGGLGYSGREATGKWAAMRTAAYDMSTPTAAPVRAPVSTAPDLATLIDAMQPPVITIDSPSDNSENRGEDVVVNYSVTSKVNLSHVRFTVNGSTTTQLLPNDPTPEGGLRLWQRLKVPQANTTIEIVAEAVGGIRSDPVLLRLKWPDAKPETIVPRPLFALIVGVGKYDERLKDELPSLSGPKLDTEVFEKALKAQVGAGKPFKFAQGGIRRIVDPTKAQFEQSLTDLRRDANMIPDSFVVIYFSGHGVSESDAAFLLPSDYDGEDVWTKAVEADRIIKMFSNRSGPVVLFLDACQSGHVANAARQRFAAGRVMNDARQSNIITYAAAQGAQPAATTATRSLFTEIVVDGIGGKAKRPNRKHVKAFDLAYYVRNEVADRSGDRQIPVVPFTANETPGASPLDLVLSIVD